MEHFPWNVLGIEATKDARLIRRAYAQRLKVTQPEDDAEGFQQLRGAYELALQIAQYEDDPSEAPAPEPAPASGDDHREAFAAAVTPAAALAPLDEAREWIEGRLRALADTLRDAERAQAGEAEKCLRTILESPQLERFDLLQLAEDAIAPLLLASLPHSDPLLKAANDRFDWAGRQLEPSTPPAARAIVARLSDLWIQDQLESDAHVHSAAWTRLKKPATRASRWYDKYVRSIGGAPEAALIETLQFEHPSLLERLPAENVRFWRELRERPHFSLFTLFGGLSLAAVVAIILNESSTRFTAVSTPQWLAVIAGAGLLFALGRLYLVDWPIVLVERRWGSRVPLWLEVGWLPFGLLLLILGALAAQNSRLGWCVAAVALTQTWWATIVSGRAPPFLKSTAFDVTSTRVFRVFFVNAIAFAWIASVTSTLPDLLSAPLLATIAAVLVGCGVARNVQVEAFEAHSTLVMQRVVGVAGVACAVGLGYLLIEHNADAAWYLPLLTALLVLMLVRRAIPFQELRINAWGYVFFGFMLVRALAALEIGSGSESDPSVEDSSVLVFGGVVILAGMVVTFATRLWRTNAQ